MCFRLMSSAFREQSSPAGWVKEPKQQSPFLTRDVTAFLVSIATCSNRQT
jgi:hypothetical protein